jgi:hypothetical protein
MEFTLTNFNVFNFLSLFLPSLGKRQRNELIPYKPERHVLISIPCNKAKNANANTEKKKKSSTR